MPRREIAPPKILRALRAASVRADRMPALARSIGVSEATFRRLRKERTSELAWTLTDWVLTAIVHGHSHTPSAINEWIDWQNHTRESDADIAATINELLASGMLQRNKQRLVLAGDWA